MLPDSLDPGTLSSAATPPKCPRCDLPVLSVEIVVGKPTIYWHAGGVHEDLTVDMEVDRHA